MPQPRPSRRIAFLRAINVGGHTVTMVRLRSLFEELGLTEVQTFIASGNVRFAGGAASGRQERMLEAHLESRLGFPVATFLRTPGEVAGIPGRQPPAARAAGVTTYVGLLRAEPAPAQRAALCALETESDTLVLEGRELYWCCRKTISQSAITGKHLERALGQPTTLRSMSTIRRLADAWGHPA